MLSPMLEIDLYKNDTYCNVDMRLYTEGATDRVLARAVAIHIDEAELLTLALDPHAYGQRLTRMVFATPRLRDAWRTARLCAEGNEGILRVRLRLDNLCPMLHSLYWELLQDPDTGETLSRSERTRFARTLNSDDSAPLILPALAELRALVAIASPSDLAVFGMTPINRRLEGTRAAQALEGLPLQQLDGLDGRRNATLGAITGTLSQGYQILYLVCHGTIHRDDSILWLEDERGSSHRVSGQALIEQIRQLVQRPVLIVLLICDSAGQPHAPNVIKAIGPQFSQLGVAAVIALHGSAPMEATSRLVSTFFRELWRTGAVDTALTSARLSAEPDHPWWLPVLWLRTYDSRCWSDRASAIQRELEQALAALHRIRRINAYDQLLQISFAS